MTENLDLQAELDGKKSTRSKLAITLLLCFAVPALAMILIYCALKVWPAGEHAVLVLDLNAQYVFYFEELRDIILNGESIIYSFGRTLGGEFLGMFAYYLSSPFSLIVCLFPKEYMTEAMYTILILKTGMCGLTFGYYLTKKRTLHPMYTVMFSMMYALSSYMVVLQHNVMWVDNVMLFPIILLAVDALICQGKYKLYVFALVYSIMSNFYIGYMTCFFVLIWFFLRYYMLSSEEKNPSGKRAHFLRSLIRIAFWTFIAILISAIIILPVYYSLSFGKLDFSDPNYEPKQLFEFLDLLTKAFFGSYDTVRPAGMPFIYCGTLALILSPLYFFSKDIPSRRKVGYAVMLLFLIVGFNFNIMDFIWHGFQRPNWLNARFAYMFVGLVLIMASDVMDKLGKIGATAVKVSAAAWCVMLLILAKLGYENLPDFLAVWASIGLLFLLAMILPDCVRIAQGPNAKRVASSALILIVTIEMIGNGVAMLYALDKDVTYTTREAYRTLIDTYEPAVELMEEIDDDTFYRAEKLYHRKKNDNFALGLNGLSNSTSTLNARAIELLQQFGFASDSHWSMYSGATPVTDAIFGINYVLADESVKKPVMDYIHDYYSLEATSGTGIDIYKNPYSLGIAFSVNEDVLDYDLPAPIIPSESEFENVLDYLKYFYAEISDDKKSEDFINPLEYIQSLMSKEVEREAKTYVDPFEYMNQLLSAMTGEEIEVWTACDVVDKSTSGTSTLNVTGYWAYGKSGSNSSYISYTVDVTEDKPIFVYFPTEYPRKATLRLNNADIGDYGKDESFAIRELGTFEVGEQMNLKVFLGDEKIYFRKNVNFFYYFDEEAFKYAMELLSDGSMTAYSERDDRIYGTITVPEDSSVIFTTIPYDAGWQVTIDGEAAETVAVLNDTLLAVKAEPGEHEIVFEYKPDCVKNGLTLTFTGLAVFILACIVDFIVKKIRARKVNEAESSSDADTPDEIPSPDTEDTPADETTEELPTDEAPTEETEISDTTDANEPSEPSSDESSAEPDTTADPTESEDITND